MFKSANRIYHLIYLNSSISLNHNVMNESQLKLCMKSEFVFTRWIFGPPQDVQAHRGALHSVTLTRFSFYEPTKELCTA